MSFEQFESGDRLDQQTSEMQLRQLGEQRLQAADNVDGQEARWIDRGVIDVPVHDLPKPADIAGASDFEKVPMAEMREGFNKLDAMKPIIDQRVGRNSDYWRAVDQNLNLEYPEGYQKVYEAFYGDDAARVDKIGDAYDIINGRHRIWLAHEMGLKNIPVHVNEKV